MLGRKEAARTMLRSIGWSVVGDKPPTDRYVLIAAPHTSNWDLPLTLACGASFDVDVRWVGKHTLFEGVQGRIMRRLGGVPVERHHRTNFVQQMADLFEQHDKLTLLVASEGTRSYTEHWKSGFYHIARSAGVPVVLGFLDYRRRECGLGPAIPITGDVSKDMDQVRAFYESKVGLHPKNFGPIRLRSEMADTKTDTKADEKA